jgi:hypothetical protein
MTPGPTLEDLIREVQHDSPGEEPLTRLRTAAELTKDVADVADAALGYFVDRARRSGHSWSEIGDALGVSKQAAQQRHVRVGGPLLEASGRVTQRARNVIAAAEFAARDLGHNFIGTEHLLLAQFSEPEALAAAILSEHGLDAAGVRAAIVERIGEGPGASADALPYTPRAVQALNAVITQALELGHNYIGTEHLLLALMDGDGVSATILREAGLEVAAVTTSITKKLETLQATAAAAATKRPPKAD